MERVTELESKLRELSTLLEVSRVINADLDLERVLHTVMAQAVTVLEAEGGTLWLVEDDEVIPRVALGPAADGILQIRLRPGEGFAGHVIRSGQGLLVADAHEDPRWASRVDAATGQVTRSVITAPLTTPTGPIGCVQLVNKLGNRRFQQSDLELLTALSSQAALVIVNSRLLDQTLVFVRSLHEAWRGTLEALSLALAARDRETRAHTYRTVELAVMIARQLGMSKDELAAIARGALLHDIGKIGIPDRILLKPGRLDEAERHVMEHHVQLGYEMLHHIDAFHDALPVVLHHHENYDGSGYPYQLKGDAIPFAARIFHVVDVYDALISDRPYKAAWTHEQAIAALKQAAGTAFDPSVVDALEQLTPVQTEAIQDIHTFSPAVEELLTRYRTA